MIAMEMKDSAFNTSASSQASSTSSANNNIGSGNNLLAQLRQFIAAESLNTSERNLMLKLLEKQRLSHLILNLEPYPNGFNIQVSIPAAEGGPTSIAAQITPIKLSYDQDELLSYIDREQICPYLVDLIEGSPALQQANLFHQGRLVVEVRDYRRWVFSSARPEAEKHFDRTVVILKPTDLNLIHEVARITDPFNSGGVEWTTAERHELEAQLILKANPDLCLDVKPQLFHVQNRLQFKKKLFNQHHFRRIAKRCSNHNKAVRLNLMRMTYSKECRLGDFLEKRRDKISQQRSSRQQMLIHPSDKTDLMIRSSVSNNPINPTTSLADLMVQSIERVGPVPPRPQTYDVVPTKIEEYRFEYLDSDKRQSVTHVSIFHRQSDDVYRCELKSSKMMTGTPATNTTTCKFDFNSKDAVKRYLNQYKEILTENGRKPVKITCYRPTTTEPPPPPPPSTATQPMNQVVSAVTNNQIVPENMPSHRPAQGVDQSPINKVPLVQQQQPQPPMQQQAQAQLQPQQLVPVMSRPVQVHVQNHAPQNQMQQAQHIQLVSGQVMSHAQRPQPQAGPHTQGITSNMMSQLAQPIHIASSASGMAPNSTHKIVQLTAVGGGPIKTDNNLQGLCAVLPGSSSAGSMTQGDLMQAGTVSLAGGVSGGGHQLPLSLPQQAVTLHILTPSKTIGQPGNLTQVAHLVQLQSHHPSHPGGTISVPVSVMLQPQQGTLNAGQNIYSTGGNGPVSMGNISIVNISRPISSISENNRHQQQDSSAKLTPLSSNLVDAHGKSIQVSGTGSQALIMQPVITSMPFGLQPLQVLHLPTSATATSAQVPVSSLAQVVPVSMHCGAVSVADVVPALPSASTSVAQQDGSSHSPIKGKARKK